MSLNSKISQISGKIKEKTKSINNDKGSVYVYTVVFLMVFLVMFSVIISMSTLITDIKYVQKENVILANAYTIKNTEKLYKAIRDNSTEKGFDETMELVITEDTIEWTKETMCKLMNLSDEDGVLVSRDSEGNINYWITNVSVDYIERSNKAVSFRVTSTLHLPFYFMGTNIATGKIKIYAQSDKRFTFETFETYDEYEEEYGDVLTTETTSDF